MTPQDERAGIPHLIDWSNAIAFIANHYRQSFFARNAACRRRVGDAENPAGGASAPGAPRRAKLPVFIRRRSENVGLAATAGHPAARRPNRRG